MNKVIGVLLLLLYCCFPSSGHNFNISFTKLSSIESGLSQSTVNTIIRDSRGDFWIGTHQGLNRYTLQGLYSYFSSRDDSLSLPNNYIYDIIEDGKGRVWIATKTGVVIYNRDEDNFELKHSDLITVMLKVDDGVILGGKNCIFHISNENKVDTLQLYDGPETGGMTDYRIKSMELLEKSGKVLLGTLKNGIYVYDIADRSISRFIEARKSPLLSILSASDGNIYVSYFGDGFCCYDKNGVMKAHYNTDNSGLNNNYIFDILEYKTHLFLATDGGGINIFNPKIGKFYHVLHSSSDNLLSTVPSITVLYRDSYNNFWAGSVRSGVFLINNNYMRTYGAVALGNTNGISENTVICIYEEKNHIWVGTDGGGVNLYDSTTDTFRHFETTFGEKIFSITPFSDKELLVSVFTKGFYLFDKCTGHCRPFPLSGRHDSDMRSKMGFLPRAQRISDNEILFTGDEIYIYNMDTQRFEKISSEGIDGYSVVEVAYQNDDFVLLKTENKAFKLDIHTHECSLLFEIPKNETITSMSYDGEKIVWIGTSTGLGYIELSDPAYHPLRSNHFSYVAYLHIDKNRRLWICAHNMLFSYSLSRKKFTQWNQYDGFMPNEILPNYHRHSSADYLFLPGVQGLVKVDLDIPDPVKYKTEIILDDILFNGKSYEDHIERGVVRIPWNYSSLSVRVTIKNKDIFQRNHLEFKVVGSNEQIIQTETPELVLSALSPGSYRVYVSCYTKDGEYIEPVNLIEIKILPPWYDAPWFKLLLGGMFIILVFSVEYSIIREQQKNVKGGLNYFLQSLLKKMDYKDDEVSNGEPSVYKSEQSQEDESFIEKLNKIIDENISNEEFGVNMLAESMGVSRASLYNKVKHIAGIGVNDYINRARIERSVYLLTHTDMSISEISYEVGFNYPRYFSTSFKNVKGITPTRFKEENKRKNVERRMKEN